MIEGATLLEAKYSLPREFDVGKKIERTCISGDADLVCAVDC